MVILKKEVTECSFNASLHSVSLVTVIAKQDLKVHVGMCACVHVLTCVSVRTCVISMLLW